MNSDLVLINAEQQRFFNFLRKQRLPSFFVRPHYRRLPPTYNASERAIARSVSVFESAPPPGKTFVMSDPGSVGSVDGLALNAIDFERPTLRYKDEDLGYSPGTDI